MPATTQIELPFACLDFSGRGSVPVWEIAKKIGVTRQHILDHIDAGTLIALDTKLVGKRSNMRVPVDEYRRWVLVRLINLETRRDFIAQLPEPTVRELVKELTARLNALAA